MVISLRTDCHGPSMVVFSSQFPDPELSFLAYSRSTALIVSHLSCTVRRLASAPLSHLVPTVSPAFFRESSSIHTLGPTNAYFPLLASGCSNRSPFRLAPRHSPHRLPASLSGESAEIDDSAASAISSPADPSLPPQRGAPLTATSTAKALHLRRREAQII